jgi:hypothetical protein
VDNWGREVSVCLTSVACGCPDPPRTAGMAGRSATDGARFARLSGCDIFQRSHAATPLTATARDNTVQRRANASGPLSAPLDVTATANKRMNSTPKNVPIVLLIAIVLAREDACVITSHGGSVDNAAVAIRQGLLNVGWLEEVHKGGVPKGMCTSGCA